MNDDLASVLVAACLGLTIVALYVVFGWRKSQPEYCNQKRLGKLIRQIMATQTELVAQVNAAKAQLEKIATETGTLQTKIAELQAIIDGMGDEANPELVEAVAALVLQAQVVDDLVPDAPTPPTP